jgi:solute carrier family 27 fatty acid transporter 1/4
MCLWIEEYSNRVAQVFLAAGYRKGDVMGLFMGTCPQYVCIWLGLAKLGITTALINTNLRNNSLSYSLNLAKVKAVIFSGELSSAVQEITSSLDISVGKYQLGGEIPEANSVKNLKVLLDSASTSPPNVQGPDYKDNVLYVYTSGTTGLPKAAVIPHSRFVAIASYSKHLMHICPDDIIFNALPLYHLTGGVFGIGVPLVFGTPVVLMQKFSASNYWKNCIKYKCTIGLYIGEICRYIMAVPPKPEDTRHQIRCMVGNGLRGTIWKDFTERFKIKEMKEAYGMTEGNVSMVNNSNKIGAVGHLPKCIPQSWLDSGLIKVDPNTYEPIRDSRGLCMRCDVGEPGMCVGVIKSSYSIKNFHGYTDATATANKILHNVFKKGDRVFLTGDILVMDEYGYLYFKDRTGDTFRCKGENISSAEVESVIMAIIGLKDAAVYGVQVPNMEGRAGMVAIADPNNALDMKNLASKLGKSLPSYARPIFIRVIDKFEITTTFKIKKTVLQKDGFDPSRIKDKLFFLSGNEYVSLTSQIYQDILNGRVRI